MSVRTRAFIREIPVLLMITYGFFLSLAFMGGGMKASFKHTIEVFLREHGSSFTELVSFVLGILATSVVQSSSTVTSLVVEMRGEGILTLTIAIGLVHGANLGTSVTSSLVAFAAETKPATGNPLRDFMNLLFAPRLPGFHRAVSAAVVHGMFNAILVTLIILVLEIPFGIIHHISELLAGAAEGAIASMDGMKEALAFITPAAYTKPIAKFLLEKLSVPGWVLVVLGFVLLFGCLKMFSSRMRNVLLAGTDPDDVEAIGRTMLGTKPADTFFRGFLLTALVQSSSATTSMVVPLAGMGFFSLRQIFPFIMGANIGTTITALMASTAWLGTDQFGAALTIALSHLLLNTVAVVMVAVIPGLYTSVIGCTEFLADASARFPATLLLYLAGLAVALPAVVYFLPTIAAAALLGTIVAVMLIGPHVYLRRKGLTVEALAGK